MNDEQDAATTTRRTFVQTLLGGAVLARLLQPQEALAAGMSKTAAGYVSHPHHGQKCSGCRYFVPPHSCQVVSGHISPNGWCRLYVAA